MIVVVNTSNFDASSHQE